MKYVYPAVFTRDGEFYFVEFPDMQEAVTQGNDLNDALYMAQDVLNTWLAFLEDTGKKIPQPSNINSIVLDDGQFANLIIADTDAWRLLNTAKATA
ncbi:MAG: type II toxin-antitoxin system HicB family antitoxin [Selenomonadaceae bacterium]|nr:type II toxin-antitoxin system HicB family antitoxin [Selenomonadaceae bacterium]